MNESSPVDRSSDIHFHKEKDSERESPIMPGEMASRETIEEETADPYTAKEIVKRYLDFNLLDQSFEGLDTNFVIDKGWLDSTKKAPEEVVTAPELHPKEMTPVESIKSKTGKVLGPLRKTLHIGGKSLSLGGLIGGILLAFPQTIALAGLEVLSLKDIAEEAVRKQSETKDRKFIDRRIELLPQSAERIRIGKDYQRWINHEEGAKSLQRIKFEILEAEIKHNHDLNRKEKKDLLIKHADKQVGLKEYNELIRDYQLKIIEAEIREDEDLMPEIKTELFAKHTARGDVPDKDEKLLTDYMQAILENMDSTGQGWDKLKHLVERHGTKAQKKMLQGKSPLKVRAQLFSLIPRQEIPEGEIPKNAFQRFLSRFFK